MNRMGTRLAIEGQGLVEYALILVLIAVVVAVAVTALGTSIFDTYGTITAALP